MKKRFVLGLATTGVALSAAGLLGVASAATSTSTGSQNIVDKIATKFNLKKADVQAVFDAEHAEKETAHQAEQSAHLQTLVDKGTITADQKTKIEAKQKEMQSARQTERTELEKWATDNGIDMQYLMPRGPKGSDSSDLQSLVDKGTITADQKTKIEAKRTELKAKRDSNRTALEQWAKDSGIDMQYLMGGFGGRGHGPGSPGGGMRGMRGDAPGTMSSNSSSSSASTEAN